MSTFATISPRHEGEGENDNEHLCGALDPASQPAAATEELEGPWTVTGSEVAIFIADGTNKC